MDLNPFSPTKKKKKQKPVFNNENFIEALKGIGGGVVKGLKRDVISDTARNAASTLITGKPISTGEINPGQPLNLESQQKELEQQQRLAEHRRLHIIQAKEQIIFSARKEQENKQITSLQEELRMLVVTAQETAKEVEHAALQETVNPGTYHVSFFEHLKRVFQMIRKTLSESLSWSQAASDRASRKKGYHGLVKKHGNQFRQSKELQMAHNTN